MKFLKPIDPAGAVEWNFWYRTRAATFDGHDAGPVLGRDDRTSAIQRIMRIFDRAHRSLPSTSYPGQLGLSVCGQAAWLCPKVGPKPTLLEKTSAINGTPS